jgi:hypothetical protein
MPQFGVRPDIPLESRFGEMESNRRMKKSDMGMTGRRESHDNLDTDLLEFVS